MTLTPRHVAQAAHIVAEELARRRRCGIPIPTVLTELDAALTRELADLGHESCGAATPPPTLETVAQRAQRLGKSQRTVRRYARQTGAKLVGRTLIFEN